MSEVESVRCMTGGLSPSIISNVAKRSSVAVRVLMLFVERSDEDNSVDILQSDICYALTATQKTVVECIKILEEEGCIVKKRTGIFNKYYIIT